MRDDSLLLGVFLLGGLCGFIIGGVLTQNNMQVKAAERGYGEYCLPNGDFAWKGECNEVATD